MSGAITVTTDIDAPLDAVWTAWTAPEHITQWNQASPDWHCPKASNDLRPGGLFSSTMAARDGSFEFEFGGEHTAVVPHERIESRLGDGRTMQVVFEAQGAHRTRVTETFEPEGQNPVEMQRAGWQAILDTFRQHVEGTLA
ncbi:polyketide cyclase [Deinococcus sp. KSM4-11]|uniref:SRPBCC family protein n=1 Tax=Deinococcus sp. KSM4-11 TaxID=2568654 RepID=UPI0010A3394B|nr:SRPBCC family protein [Deinococcus sp. KSM4-11]THF87082.1 polyketide cyclase [Deinococcus sp. KSM4-11]